LHVREARALYGALDAEGEATSLSDVVNPLVIDESGRCLAFTYGIHPHYAVADLTQDWPRALIRARTESREPIARLLVAAFHGACDERPAYIDWFAHLARVSYEIGPGLGPACGSA
jgi:hypothetical protein